MRNIKLLRWLFLFLMAVNFILIIFTPRLINKGNFFVKEEEDLEVLIIALLFIIGYNIYFFYKRELNKRLKELNEYKNNQKTLEERLNDAFKHMGSLNLQINEIKSVFSDFKKYPENKSDFKLIMDFLANKILSIINADWVVIRILDLKNLQTLKEFSASRGSAVLLKYNLSNKELADGNAEHFSCVCSEEKNLNLKVFCVFPKISISDEQEIFLRAIANQIEILFIIFTSNYYKNSHFNLYTK